MRTLQEQELRKYEYNTGYLRQKWENAFLQLTHHNK